MEQLSANQNAARDAINTMVQDILSGTISIKTARDIEQETLEGIYGIGFNLYQSRKTQDALDIFRFLCLLDSMNSKYMLALAACYQVLHDYTKAIEIYSLTMLLDANDPMPPFRAGECHLALGNTPEAESGFTAAIEWAGDKPQYTALVTKARTLRTLIRNRIKQ